MHSVVLDTWFMECIIQVRVDDLMIFSMFKNLWIYKKVTIVNWFQPLLPAVGMIKLEAVLSVLADLLCLNLYFLACQVSFLPPFNLFLVYKYLNQFSQLIQKEEVWILKQTGNSFSLG